MHIFRSPAEFRKLGGTLAQKGEAEKFILYEYLFMEKEYPFYQHQEDNNEIVGEFRRIMAKPEGERIDGETLNIIRTRLANRLEAQWTDPKEPLVEEESTQIVEILRNGGRILDSVETRQALAQLLQDYRFSPDDKDAIKENILGEKLNPGT